MRVECPLLIDMSSPRRWGCFRGLCSIAGYTEYSPRMWGCFRPDLLRRERRNVFPMQVGVFPRSRGTEPAGLSLPHTRGGVSPSAQIEQAIQQSSPRPWGCFRRLSRGHAELPIFPTPVGVFPTLRSSSTRRRSLPHTGGGVSEVRSSLSRRGVSSLRRWGCFLVVVFISDLHRVFPTGVGVLPRASAFLRFSKCLPHGRGGVSSITSGAKFFRVSSPRLWGCFLHLFLQTRVVLAFPMLVGVFPCILCHQTAAIYPPCACGGVSDQHKLSSRGHLPLAMWDLHRCLRAAAALPLCEFKA